MDRARKVKTRPPTIHSDRPRVRVLRNDNYCVTQQDFVDMAGSKETVVKKTGKKVAYVDNYQTSNINSLVADHAPFAIGQLQRKV